LIGRWALDRSASGVEQTVVDLTLGERTRQKLVRRKL
jgi:hypothetical protein